MICGSVQIPDGRGESSKEKKESEGNASGKDMIKGRVEEMIAPNKVSLAAESGALHILALE